MGDEPWDGEEKRAEYIDWRIMKSSLKSACNKSKFAIATTFLFIGVTFWTMSIAYSARSTADTSSKELQQYQKMMERMLTCQEEMKRQLNHIEEFTELLKNGRIKNYEDH